MPQDTRLATYEGLLGLQRAQHSVENGPGFGCMWWHNKSFRLRVYFDTQMPAPLAHPAPIGTVRMGAEVHRGVDLAAASPRGHDMRGRSRGGVHAGVGSLLTGVAGRFVGEAGKRRGLTPALWRWGQGLR